MPRRLSLVVPLAALVAAALACTPAATPPGSAPTAASAGKDTTGVSDTEIVIGMWVPLSGNAASLYAPIGKAHEAFFKMLNEQGGINGRKIRYVQEDDQYDPAKTVPLVKKMVEEDKVFAFLGGLGTPNGVAVLDYIVQNHVPHLAPSTGSSKWSDPVQPGYYAWQINYKSEARILAKYGVETLGKKKFAIFYQNDDFGKEGFNEAKAALAKRGGEVAAEVAYNTTDTDYSAHALKLQQSGADAVLTWAVPGPFGSLMKEAGKLGFKPTWLNSAVVNDASVRKLATDEQQGAYFVAWLPNPEDTANADNPAIKEWRENLPKYGPDVPLNTFALSGWGQARLLREVLNRAGRDLSRQTFEQAAQTLSNFKDLTTVTWTATDRRGTTQGWMEQVQGEKSVKITDFIQAD
ncbi:MAG TPA: ABC transporter substrate-binding protein [Chloroflexota bacterium]|nr:ABC transporter substrate-binding protein [Chloroflexota bacterium]